MEKLPLDKKNIFKFSTLVFLVTTALVLAYIFNLRGFVGTLAGRSHGLSTILFFVSLYIVLILSLLPSAPLNILSGALFGPVVGTLYSWIAVVLGGAISFMLARYFGEPLVSAIVKEKSEKLEKLNEKLQKDSWEIVLLFRIIPFFPISGFNYLFGLSKMRLRSYLLGSVIGTVPGIFILSYFGDSLASFTWYKIAVALGLLLLMAIISWWYKTKHRQI